MHQHHYHHLAGAHVDRRSAILGTAAALAGVALVGPSAAQAKDRGDDDARPQAAPRPIPGTFPSTDFHVFGPGPESITLPFSHSPLMGLHVDPSVITDFSGFTALAYPVGRARGSDGRHYNLEGDMRLFSGTYVPLSGGRRHGTFGLV